MPPEILENVRSLQNARRMGAHSVPVRFQPGDVLCYATRAFNAARNRGPGYEWCANNRRSRSPGYEWCASNCRFSSTSLRM
jgi:hypothetical protein